MKDNARMPSISGRAHRAPALMFALGLVLALGLTQSSCETTYEFDELTVGSDDDTREPRARENSQFLRAVYADLLDRTPENYDLVVYANGTELGRLPVDEQEFLLGALSSVGDPAPMRSLLTAGMVASEEVEIPAKSEIGDPAEFINEQFQRLLGRDANAYELEAFVREWNSDSSVNPRTVIRAIIGSREYQSF